MEHMFSRKRFGSRNVVYVFLIMNLFQTASILDCPDFVGDHKNPDFQINDS